MKEIINDFRKFGEFIKDDGLDSLRREHVYVQDQGAVSRRTGRTTAEIAAALEAKPPQRIRYKRTNRFQILKNAGFKCLACGATSHDTTLHIDHIKPQSTHPELVNEPDNLQVLCAACNISKSNKFDDDLR